MRASVKEKLNIVEEFESEEQRSLKRRWDGEVVGVSQVSVGEGCVGLLYLEYPSLLSLGTLSLCDARDELRKQADQLKKEIKEAKKQRERDLQDGVAEEEGEYGRRGDSVEEGDDIHLGGEVV